MRGLRAAVRFPSARQCVCSASRRCMATESAAPVASTSNSTSAPAYPYSSSVKIISHPTKERSGPLLQHINERLRASASDASLISKHLHLFDRSNPRRALPGSVMSVTYYSSPAKTGTSTFSGVLLGVTRKNYGLDTSFRLRSVVARTGVEMSFKVSSSMIKEVMLVSRADRSRGQKVSRSGSFIFRARRAKLFYLRDQPKRMPNTTSAIKAKEQQMARLRAKANPEPAQAAPKQQTAGKKGSRSGKGGKKGKK